MLDRLPGDILLKIFEDLRGYDLVCCSEVNARLRRFTTDKLLWSAIYQKEVLESIYCDKCVFAIFESIQSLPKSGTTTLEQTQDSDLEKFVHAMRKIMKYMYKQGALTYTNPTSILGDLSRKTCYNQSILIGPGIDESQTSKLLFQQLMLWYNHTETDLFKKSISSNKVRTVAGYAGSGLAFGIPGTQAIIRLLTIHARSQAERESLPYGGHRLWGNGLMRMIDGGLWWKLDGGIQQLVKISNSVIYVINAGKNTLEDHARFDWDGVRHELCAITQVMSKKQKLLILSLTTNIHYWKPIELAKILKTTEGGERAAKNPLRVTNLRWAIWDGMNLSPTHLSNILLWLFK